MKVRPAASSDCERLVQLFRQMGYAIDASELRAGLLAYEGSDSDLALVAEIGGEVVGAIVLHIIAPLHEGGEMGAYFRFSGRRKHQAARHRNHTGEGGGRFFRWPGM